MDSKTTAPATAAAAGPEIIARRFAPYADNALMRELQEWVIAYAAGREIVLQPASAETATPPKSTPLPLSKTAASAEEIHRLTKDVEHLFTLPDHVLRIMQLLRSPRASIDEIVREINKDPVLAAETLRVVNSGFYGFQHQVSSIQHAIVIMGLHVVQSIVLSVAVVNFRALKEIWRHSIVCAYACGLLAQEARLAHGEEIHVAGLLHDIGKAVLAEYLSERYLAAVSLAEREQLVFYEAERLQLGATHAEIGQWLLARWHLSPAIVAAVAGHHAFHPEAQWKEYTAVVHIADVLANAVGCSGGINVPVPALSPDALAVVGLEKSILAAILTKVMNFAKLQSQKDVVS